MACDARWISAERGGQMSLYGCLSAIADYQLTEEQRLDYTELQTHPWLALEKLRRPAS